MRTLIVNAGLAMLLAQVGSPRCLPQTTPSPQYDTTQVAAQFEMRVQRYVILHRALEGLVPTVAVSNDYAEVRAAVDALAAKIRAARKDARRGDVFTPEIECWFREMMVTSLAACDTQELLAALNEENPPDVVFVPVVNGRWPEEASFGPMPPKLLADLPQLPNDLQYRFLDRDLVLWDAHANLIVDFIKKALP